MPDDIAERRGIFRTVVPYFGTVRPASFFRDTSAVVKGVKRIHPLIEGIYKPAGSFYPLSIASMLKSRYSDQLFHNPDRTWWMHYSPNAGGMDLAVNAGLVRCMTDRQPVLVLRQESDKTSASGARQSAPTIRRHTCCMKHCARSSVIMSRRRARWLRPTGCVSTSRIRSRSRLMNSSASKT